MGNVMDKLAGMIRFGNDNDDYDDYDDDDGYVEPEEESKVPSEPKAKIIEKKQQSVVAPKRKLNVNDNAVCVFKPKSFDEAREIVETFLENKTVVLNFEGVDLTISQRILDTATGACIAVGGNLQKISNYIFMVTPASVDVSGEFQDNLNAYDAL